MSSFEISDPSVTRSPLALMSVDVAGSTVLAAKIPGVLR